MPLSWVSVVIAHDTKSIALSLFGGFVLTIGGARVALPMHARRVLAYLSLQPMPNNGCNRQLLAQRLWIDSPPDRSRASLRTAMWKIRVINPLLLVGDSEQVALAGSVHVDVHEFRRRAEGLLAAESGDPFCDVALLRTPVDLLPGWEDDWLLLSREQLRLLRLHALERSAQRICGMGCYPQAIDLILPVVSEEPLRESAQSILITAHLKCGNLAEACRQYDRFADHLFLELGVRPSEALSRLVEHPAMTTRTT